MQNNNISLSSLRSEIKKTENFKENIATVAQYARTITSAKRCSLFIFNQEKNKLQSIYSDGVKGSISLNPSIGILGYCFHKKKSILENNSQQNPMFFNKVDEKLNYHTKTILAVPIIDDKHNRLGVIQLLNKEDGFNEQDQLSIEKLSELLITVLDSSIHQTLAKEETETKEVLNLKNMQNKFDHYLTNKKLYLKEDGSAYYKILNMKREYFISANECYVLEDTPKKLEIYYYDVTGEFLPVAMYLKIHEETKGLQVSENIAIPNFSCYPLEEDDIES